MADVEQDRMLGRQLGGGNRLALRPFVSVRNDDLEWLFVQKIRDDARRLERQRDNRGTDAPRA